MKLKLVGVAIISAALSAITTHHIDAVIVASILHSSDRSITHNVEQANALLDISKGAY